MFRKQSVGCVYLDSVSNQTITTLKLSNLQFGLVSYDQVEACFRLRLLSRADKWTDADFISLQAVQSLCSSSWASTLHNRCVEKGAGQWSKLHAMMRMSTEWIVKPAVKYIPNVDCWQWAPVAVFKAAYSHKCRTILRIRIESWLLKNLVTWWPAFGLLNAKLDWLHVWE